MASPPTLASSSAQRKALPVSIACGQKLALVSMAPALAAVSSGEASANGAARCSSSQPTRPATTSMAMSSARRISMPPAAQQPPLPGVEHGVDERHQDDDEQHQRVHAAVVEI